MFGDIDLIFLVYECIMMSYRSSLHFVPVQRFLAELWPLDLKFDQIFSCHHFILLWFEILNWFLVWECIIISYRSILNSFRLNDFWSTYSHSALKFGQIFSCHHFFFTMIWDIDLVFRMWVYSDELLIKFEFCSDWMILG